MPTNHRADVCADGRISISLLSPSRRQLGLSLHPSDAQLHIVTDNKATSVETGSTLFSEKTSVQRSHPEQPRSSGLLRATTPLSRLLAEPTAGVDVVRRAELDASPCGGKTRAGVRALALVASTSGAIWLIWQILEHLPPFVCLKDDSEPFVFERAIRVQRNPHISIYEFL